MAWYLIQKFHTTFTAAATAATTESERARPLCVIHFSWLTTSKTFAVVFDSVNRTTNAVAPTWSISIPPVSTQKTARAAPVTGKKLAALQSPVSVWFVAYVSRRAIRIYSTSRLISPWYA